MKQVYVPAEISVEIEMSEYRKYKLNVAKAFFDQSTFIPPNYKRKLKGRILTTGPGKTTKSGTAEIRITGDYTDHIRIKDVVSSLHVKLLDDHLSGIRVFKHCFLALASGIMKYSRLHCLKNWASSHRTPEWSTSI